LFQEARHGIRPHASGERLSALLAERERVLRDVQRRKQRLERAASRMRESAQATLEKLGPLIARQEALAAEISALFEELLAPGRLSASARKKVVRVRRMLEEQGVLDGSPNPFPGGEDDENNVSPFGSDSEPTWAPDGPPGYSPRDVASAPQHGQAPSRDTLRALFRRLARSVHPDLAAHEPERERRTEAMKQVTQAYEAGDLARLLELESAWKAGERIPATGDSEERCRELERVIRELRAQAKDLARQLRELERAMPRPMTKTSIDDLVAQGETELEAGEHIRDFVRGFRDGQITLAQFVRGPDLGHDDDADLLIFEMALEMARRADSGARRGRARARKR
jgi:hypothetical protein